MIELYLKERESYNNDSWLFANMKAEIEYEIIIIDGKKKKREISREYNYIQCSLNTFSESLKVICRKLNIANITPKSLRRYFNTILKRNKIDYEIRERLLGHKIDISKGSAYDEILNDSYKLAKFYSEKIEILTLLGNGNRKITEVDKRVENLEIRNKGLEQTIKELKDSMGFMSKFMLSLDQTFRVETDKDYTENPNDVITYSEEEMKEFREKVKELNQK